MKDFYDEHIGIKIQGQEFLFKKNSIDQTKEVFVNQERKWTFAVVFFIF